MVFELLDQECLNGPASVPIGARHGVSVAENSVRESKAEMFSQQPTDLIINHRGRLRLARLQEELLTNRQRDRFGILIDQRHWERDLRVRLISASSSEPLVLILADIDHFKAVNEALGYGAADDAIRAYFRVAHDVLADDGDVYCRGGDEVLAVLPGTSLAEAQTLGEALRLAVEAEFVGVPIYADHDLAPPTVCVGVAIVKQPAKTEVVADFANSLLNEAKLSRKNRVEAAIFDSQ